MKKLIAICAVVLFIVGNANAAFTTYFSRAAWEAAVDNSFDEEFFADATLNPGVSVVSDEGYVTSGYWYDYLGIGIPASTTTFTFDTDIVGYGGDWDTSPPSGNPAGGIAFSADGAYVDSVGDWEVFYGFFGFTSTTPFNTVVLGGSSGGDMIALDNMVYSVIPAPGAILLGGIGVGLVGWLKRRKTL